MKARPRHATGIVREHLAAFPRQHQIALGLAVYRIESRHGRKDTIVHVDAQEIAFRHQNTDDLVAMPSNSHGFSDRTHISEQFLGDR